VTVLAVRSRGTRVRAVNNGIPHIVGLRVVAQIFNSVVESIPVVMAYN
jgi:hypothetical protein